MSLHAQFLDSIVVVMVNTTLPANIGSAARAMHTMGLSHLTVVEPKLPIDADAIAHAAGATAILDKVEIVPTLADAVADCQWVLAASSRKRTMPQLVITPRQAANLMVEQFLQQNNFATDSLNHSSENFPTSENFPKIAQKIVPKIALLFGREDRGLTNEELQLADYHIQIPANPAYGVLNVAAAVQVIASVFFETAVEKLDSNLANQFSDLPTDFSNQPSLQNLVFSSELSQQADLSKPSTSSKQITHIIRQDWDEMPISHEQKQHLQSKILQILEQVDLYNPAEPKVMPHRLARLSQRLQLDVKEYELLQSLIAKVQKKLNN